MDADPGSVWLKADAACHHGSHCSCRALARALGLAESAIDFNYCRNVLQKHWRMSCDHLPLTLETRQTLQVPPHDTDDPVHMILLANIEHGSDERAVTTRT